MAKKTHATAKELQLLNGIRTQVAELNAALQSNLQFIAAREEITGAVDFDFDTGLFVQVDKDEVKS